MNVKTIALFLSISFVSAGGFFTSSAHAKSPFNIDQASSSASVTASLRLSSRNDRLSSSYLGVSYVEIHNHTDWSIRVWIDGTYTDDILPHHHLTVPVGSGYTLLQAQSFCPCGRSWKSSSYFDSGYTYSWILD